jgi:putative FmdB family regulatory protein
LPLYEYRCKKCGRVVEKIQKFSDPPLTKCEHCGGKLEQLLSAPAIQFKGAGWYVTDYAKKPAASGSNTPSDSASTEKKGMETKEKETSKPAEPAKAAPSKD